MKHFVKTPVREKGSPISLYKTQCGMIKPWKEVEAKALHKISCPECLLAVMTLYETKICLLEEVYNTLYPERPVGEKLQ